jgi:hypothetical protein
MPFDATEVVELRKELVIQWEANHCERCCHHWPHEPEDSCYWPLPKVLTEEEASSILDLQEQEYSESHP